MSIATLRAKNQVTLPGTLLEKAGIHTGDPLDFTELPGGGIAVYRYGRAPGERNALLALRRIGQSIPGNDSVDFDFARIDGEPRTVNF